MYGLRRFWAKREQEKKIADSYRQMPKEHNKVNTRIHTIIRKVTRLLVVVFGLFLLCGIISVGKAYLEWELIYNRCGCVPKYGCRCEGPPLNEEHDVAWVNSPDKRYSVLVFGVGKVVSVSVEDNQAKKLIFEQNYLHESDLFINEANVAWRDESTSFDVKYHALIGGLAADCLYRFEITARKFSLTCQSPK